MKKDVDGNQSEGYQLRVSQPQQKMKSKYARLRMNGKTFFAKILSETDGFIYFRKVDKYGDETEEKMVKGTTNGQHVITEHIAAKGLITRRTEMKMSLKYAELEPA